MDYCETPSALLEFGGARTEICEPDCSPHPMDFMAIYALYQSRD